MLLALSYLVLDETVGARLCRRIGRKPGLCLCFVLFVDSWSLSLWFGMVFMECVLFVYGGGFMECLSLWRWVHGVLVLWLYCLCDGFMECLSLC